jgi:cell wall-associated NlpC family hydrolase
VRACCRLSPEVVIRPTVRQRILVLLVITAALAATSAASAQNINSKRAEAEQVLSQIQEIDSNLDLAVDAYNASQIRLDEIEAQQRLNRGHLKIVRANYRKAQAAISRRLVALYQKGDPTVVELLLGATSLGEILDRLETVRRVSDQDLRVVREIRTFRVHIRKLARELKRAQAEQRNVVAERASRKAVIEGRLAERQRLLASIKDQIAELEAEEAARQRRLQAQARERLEAAQASVPATLNLSDLSAAAAEGDGTAPPARFGGAVGIAMQYLGIPYQWAGSSPSTGFDCSGFVMYVYAQLGVALPHNAAAQFAYGTPVSREELQPGDLVFFNSLGHNGMYIGGGQFIHSPHTGDVVKISSLYDAWYAATWVGGRRL